MANPDKHRVLDRLKSSDDHHLMVVNPMSKKGTERASNVRRMARREGVDLEEYLNTIRLSLLRQALERTGGHQKKAAELLRLSYRAFRYHADKLGLAKDDEAGS